jgi:hypothetical protein
MAEKGSKKSDDEGEIDGVIQVVHRNEAAFSGLTLSKSIKTRHKAIMNEITLEIEKNARYLDVNLPSRAAVVKQKKKDAIIKKNHEKEIKSKIIMETREFKQSK